MEELKQLAKLGSDFDEEPLKARALNLISRRREVSIILDEQNKFSIGIYQHLDQKIKDFGNFDACSNVICLQCWLFPAVSFNSCLYFSQIFQRKVSPTFFRIVEMRLR